MSKYQELLAQRDALEAQMKSVMAQERNKAIEEIRSQMALYEIDASELGARARKLTRKKKAGTVPAKYRDPATGSTWSGRGREPRWIAGKNRADFLVN